MAVVTLIGTVPQMQPYSVEKGESQEVWSLATSQLLKVDKRRHMMKFAAKEAKEALTPLKVVHAVAFSSVGEVSIITAIRNIDWRFGHCLLQQET